MQCDDEQKMKIYSIYKKKIPIDRKSLAKHFMDAGKMLRAVHCRTYSTQLMWTLNIWHLTFLLKCSSQFQKNLSSLRFYFWASLKFLEPKFRVCDRWVFFPEMKRVEDLFGLLEAFSFNPFSIQPRTKTLMKTKAILQCLSSALYMT